MKGVCIEAPGSMQVMEVPDPRPEQGKAIVRMHLCGICGSDISAYQGNSAMALYPLVLGHEGVGRVAQIDPGNPLGLEVGDRVVCEPVEYCGTCYACRVGKTNNCDNILHAGVRRPGMMAEYFQNRDTRLHRVPDNLSDEEACMIEPLTIGLHATNRVRLRAGEKCVVVGGGTIGLLCALSARVRGAQAIVIDPVNARLAQARKLGFDTLHPGEGDVFTRLRQWGGGELPAVLYECSGASAAVAKFHEYVSVSGRVVMVGWPHEDLSINMIPMLRKELDVYGTRNSLGCFPQAIELISSGRVKVDGLISRTVPAQDAKEAFDRLIAHPSDDLKVLVAL